MTIVCSGGCGKTWPGRLMPASAVKAPSIAAAICLECADRDAPKPEPAK